MKITGKQRVLNHKERHPNDNNERNPDKGVAYAMVKETKEKEPSMNAIRNAMMIIEKAKYTTLEIDDDCPKCEGKVIWKGSTKYRSTHCRCNSGCIL
tara:strand:- start:594 stop:884 length:291 start_codon:yes stop_codon:yes gene_type:complete